MRRLTQSPDEALRHVEARAAHLAQPRPEYGHCTNASCIVGRRGVTRGLHLDRRAFLVSYDPTIDPDDAILERILAAVGPVGAGISLEYYFSSVDNETFGCGTKLPHNVTGLIGVMNGHQSDLRTGLPLQMVELHEPMRLLLDRRGHAKRRCSPSRHGSPRSPNWSATTGCNSCRCIRRPETCPCSTAAYSCRTRRGWCPCQTWSRRRRGIRRAVSICVPALVWRGLGAGSPVAAGRALGGSHV